METTSIVIIAYFAVAIIFAAIANYIYFKDCPEERRMPSSLVIEIAIGIVSALWPVAIIMTTLKVLKKRGEL